MAFLFSTASILLILGLCRLRAFQPGVVVLAGLVFFSFMSWQFNALLSGDAAAKSMGVAVDRLRRKQQQCCGAGRFWQ